MKKLSTFLKTLLVAVGIGVGSSAWAQTAYWTEDFEDDLGTGWTLSGASRQSNSSMDKKLGTMDLRIEKKADAAEAQYVITPTFSKGVSTVTFWQCRSSNRTLTIYTSTDGGTNWWKYTTVTANSSEIATVTINSMTVNRIKIANESGSDADIDNLTVSSKATVYAEDYESTSLEAIQSEWDNNDGSWPTAESKGTYSSRLYYFDNQCGNTTKWFCAASRNDSRQTTAYYFFNSAYTGKAYQHEAKLNLNVGNNNAAESRLYFMNGAKSTNNNAPDNYLFYIGVNSSGYAYISNGTDSDISTIGNVTGTENISNVVQEAGKNYKSTGWIDVSCLINFEEETVNVTIKRGNATQNLSVSLKSGPKQLSGFGVLDGAKTGGVVAFDDVNLYELTYPAFALSEIIKEVAKSGNTTVDVTDLTGTISVTSADESIATASYADGTITINGVALGTTTLTVSCTNDGFTVTKDINVTVEHGVTYNTPALYSEDFESYDISKETPDNPTAAGWTIHGGSSKIEKNSNASINQCAWFNADSGSGNRGQYYNFASSVVSDAANYWKIEFDAALTAGSDRTESSVAITSANSDNVASNSAASGSLYFLCKQKTNNSNVYEVFLGNFPGNSTSEASATYTLTNGTFYHFVITYNGTTVTAKIGSNAKISKEVNASTVGALKGLKTCESRGNSCIVRIDNITLHNFNAPAFTLAETEKTINQGGNGTVSVTDVEGEISVESSNTSVATASYADGTITITGVAGGTANITVNCFNNGVNAPAGTIATTIISYAEQYTTAKAVYDAKVENLDAAGQAYWTSNVTDVASVVDAASCSAAIAALPTTYLAAVKAQGAGSDMTDAMPTGNTGWTVNQGNGPASYGSTGATETYSDGGATYAKFSTGNIMSQTITGLPNGLYKVQFYGVVNAANNVSTVSGADLVQAYANDVNLDIDVVLQNSCTPTNYLRTIQAEVTDGTLTYGLKVKDEVTDAGNWAVAKTFKLTFLGDTKYNYTINAVAGETTIKQLGTGSEYPGLDYGAYVPYVIQYNSKYYVLDDNSTYYKNFTMGAADATKEVSYTLDESIVYFAEANSIYGGHSTYGTVSNDSKYSMGNGVGCYTDAYITTSSTLAPGTYNIMLGCVVRKGNNTQPYGISYSTDKSSWTSTGVSISYSGTSGGVYTPSANVQLASTSYLRLTNNFGGNAQDYLDYVLIRNFSAETSAFNSLKTYADALVAVPNDNASANSTFSTAISTQAAAVAAATTAEAITTATSTLLTAMNTYVAAANPTAGNQFDLTYLLTDPNGETYTVWGAAGDFGYYTDIPTSGVGTYNNFVTRVTSEDSWTQSKNAVERYTSDVYATANTWALYQKVTLPVGKYSFDGYALANNASTIVMAAGDAEGDAVTASNFTAYTVDFTKASEGETKLGLKISATGTNACNWMAIAEIKLYKEALSVSGIIPSSGYGSLASAYGLDFSSATVSSGTLTAYVVTSTATDKVTLTSVDELPANQGVILKGTPGATYNIPVKADAAYAGANLLSAAVTATDIAANTAYILQGGKLHLVTAASTVPAGKAYLLASNVPSGARSMTFVFDDEATGVGASLMNNEERTMNNEVYDLQGRRVDGSRLTVNGSRLNPGIYIKNGRKVVVK